MAGIFKRLSANDIKITPFEAHKQYDTTDLASIGASTSSLGWSPDNKSDFDTGSKKYYQIDKLYYRNYIRERAYRLELDDATYTTQERRLYQSASVLSLSQKTFGSEVQPKTFELSGSNSDLQFNFKDDGFGNIYNVDKGTDNFPNEDHRLLYLGPTQAFKRVDLTIDYKTGKKYVNNPFSKGYSRTVYDDSYFLNEVEFNNVNFTSSINTNFHSIKTYNSSTVSSSIIIPHKPQFNFETNDEFTITFYYDLSDTDKTNATLDGKQFLLTKEGTKTVASLPSEKTKDISLRTSGSADLKKVPIGNQFPYRIYLKGNTPSTNKRAIFFERSDGETIQVVSASLHGKTETGTKFVSCKCKNGNLIIEIDNAGEVLSTDQNSPTLNKTTSNKADITLYNKPQPNGSYTNYIGSGSGIISQLMIWDKALTRDEITNVSESITGTPNVGNIFYDNGFTVITHPTYMDIFNGGDLNTLKYKNTHLITENEYQCTMTEDEFEFTTNPTARKIPFKDSEDIADFTTGSNFKPYITSVGLYDDMGNLLVVGKLAQPIKASSETDTTFVIRYDT